MANKISQPITLSLLFFIVLLSGGFLNRFSNAQEQQQRKREEKPKFEKISSHVIIISISGLRADDVNKAAELGLNIQTILKLRMEGCHAVSVESVYPTATNPAHTSIATGALPADHGITSDYPFEEQSGTQSQEPFLLAKEIKTDPIWETAKRAEFTTAAVAYPLTAGAAITFNLPVADDLDGNDEKYDTNGEFVMSQYVNPPNLLDQLKSELKLGAFPENKKLKEISFSQKQDYFKAEAAAYLISKHRPNLLLINFTSFDKAQRRYGLLSREAKLALESVDDFLKRIIDASERSQSAPDTTFIVVSDYGSMSVEHEFKPNSVLAKRKWLTCDHKGRVTSWRAVAQTSGGSAAIFVKNPQDEKTVREVEKIFSEYHEKPDSPIWRIVTRREASQLGADPQPAFYLDAAPSYSMSSRVNGSAISKPSQRAEHGFLPSRSEMRATLIIAGKGIKTGSRIEYARLIDIAPTVARILGLEMRTARGRVLTEAINK